MIKHVGLHNAQKIIIVLRKLPSETHMCLILVNDKLPARYFTEVMKVLQSEEGQKADDFSTALDSVTFDDGQQLSRILYTGGHLKKVPTNQVFVTPDKINKVKLNELNEYLDQIAAGGEGLKKLQELDEASGMRKTRPNSLAAGVQKSAEALEDFAEQHPFPTNRSEPTDINFAKTLSDKGLELRNTAEQLLKQANALEEQAKTIANQNTKPEIQQDVQLTHKTQQKPVRPSRRANSKKIPSIKAN